MLNFNNKLLLLVALLALNACQSVLKPASDPSLQQQAQAAVAQAADINQQLYEDAIASLKSGKSDLAIELLVKVSRETPKKKFVFTNLGLAYLKFEKYDFAEQAFQQAIKHNSNDAVAHNHLGILQRRKGEFDSARQRYQRAIDIDKGYARAHLNLGILFDIYLQDLGKALKQYEKYQALTNQQDSQVAGWIVDIERRIKSATKKSQG
jgi:Flp pilus assembly protein TadD